MTARDTQPERTVLSWQRTGLGVLAVAALLARAAATGGAPVRLVVAGGVALLVTAVVLAVAGAALGAVLSPR